MPRVPLDRDDVHLFHSNLWQTATTLVELPGAVMLFDPTYFPSELAAIRAFAEERAAGKDRVLVYTHSDWDHVVGSKTFADWSSIATTLVAAKTDDERAVILHEITNYDGQWYVPRQETIPYPRIDRTIDGITETTIAGSRVVFVPTPGHTNDGLATFFPETGVCVAGDLLSDLEFPFVYFSPSAYRRTLDVMRHATQRYHTTLLLTGHGPPATSAAEIAQRIDNDVDYLDRLDALDAGDDGSDFTYRGAPINPHIASFHRANLALVRKERAAPSR